MSYSVDDYVSFSGLYWRCALPHSDSHQPGSDSYWVVLNNTGAWSPNTYAQNDMVSSGSAEYYDSVGGLSTVDPPSDSRWRLLTYAGSWSGGAGTGAGALGFEELNNGSGSGSGSGLTLALSPVGGLPGDAGSVGGTVAGAAILLGLIQEEGEADAAFEARVAATSAGVAAPVVVRDAQPLVDVSTFVRSCDGLPDLDVMFTPIYGGRVLAERIARMLTTTKGSLPYAPDWGIDIRDFVNGHPDEYEVAASITGEIEREPTIESASASVTIAESALRIKVRANLTSGAELAFALSVAEDYVEVTV